MKDNYITIEEFLKILRKRIKLILFIIMVFTSTSFILSFYVIKPKYEAATKFFIGKESIGEDKSYSQNDVIMYQNLMKTYSEIINTPDILATSIDKSNLDLDVADVLDKLKVLAIADTQILEVSYRSVDIYEAKKFINSLTNEFINISEELVPNGNVKVLQKVRLTENPVTPNKKLNIVIAVSYTHLRANETGRNPVCRLLLEKKKKMALIHISETPRQAETSYAVCC